MTSSESWGNIVAEDFRKRLKRLMDGYRQKNLSMDEVYKDAPSRQLRLVSTCFDACIEAVLERAAKSGTPADELKGRGILDADATDLSLSHAVKAAGFYPHGSDVNAMPEDDMKKIRQRMVDFLESQCGFIVIIDGDVKPKKRALEKAQEDTEGSILDLNDINRLTVVSSDAELLETFIHKLHAKCSPDAVCAKENWEMKYFGMLSRSNYIFIDGFPAEIHLNEPKQMMVSKVVTHAVYEVMRINTTTDQGEREFHDLYAALPEQVKKSIKKHAVSISVDDLNELESLSNDLADTVARGSQGNLKTKYNQLLDFHRECHRVFFEKSSPEWKKVYDDAQAAYNEKMGISSKVTTNKRPENRQGYKK